VFSTASKEVIDMMYKILYGIMGGVVLLVIGLILGLITGAIIGGNYLTEFEFGGVCGYEAVGKTGAIIGGTIGALFGVMLGVKLAKKKIPRVFRFILVMIFIIFALLKDENDKTF
jgi:uncharacterized membrane protein YfcA